MVSYWLAVNTVWSLRINLLASPEPVLMLAQYVISIEAAAEAMDAMPAIMAIVAAEGEVRLKKAIVLKDLKYEAL